MDHHHENLPGCRFDEDCAVEVEKEAQTWRAKLEQAEDVKARLLLEKLSGDDAKTKTEDEMLSQLTQEELNEKAFKDKFKGLQDQIADRLSVIQELKKRKRSLDDKLRCKRAESTKLQQKFKIHAEIPGTNIKVTQKKEEGSTSGPLIRGMFSINERPSILLQGGQALVTFEEENVVPQILKLSKCSVVCDNTHVDVVPQKIKIDPTVKFEVHLDVSKKKLLVLHAPLSMCEERMKNRLDTSFGKPSKGGGEVEQITYNDSIGTGQITFLDTGVAEGLALRQKLCVDVESDITVQVGLDHHYQLSQFQTVCGTSRHTLLLDGIEAVVDEDDLQDYLEIHFQKPVNFGGEIESIKYIPHRTFMVAMFCEDKAEMGP